MGIQSKLMKTLKKMSGVGVQSDAQNTPSHVLSDTTTHRKYSPSEYQVLSQRHHIEPATRVHARNTDLAQIISYLQPSHEHAVMLVQDVERLRALAPEIGQAENIIVSSIMSPNDLQDADPLITIKELPGLSETTRNQITELLEEYFLRVHHLGPKMTKWCGEALFRSGSAVTMILPESTLAGLIGYRDMLPNKGAGKESLDQIMSDDTYKFLLRLPLHSKSSESNSNGQETLITYDRSNSNGKPKEESKLSDTEVKNILAYLIRENVVAVSDQKETSVLSELRGSIESITAKITTELEEGDTLFLSENPEVLRFGSMVRQYNKKKLGKNVVDQYAKQVQENPKGHQIEDNIIDLTPFVDDEFKNFSAPFFIELPSESVIPICVPGSKTEKLGYFVLIDAFGQPIEASKYLSTMTGCSTSGRIQASYSAMFGNKPTESGIKTSLFQNVNRIGNPWDLQQNAIAKVFDYVLDEQLKKKLKNVGLGEIDLDKYNSIATCMFYRLLEKKRTTLVFVPEEIMSYVAFDYREDGAGKSKLEDAQFILSLRVTFLVANIMAMMRNAVARKEIEVSFDEKETQFESVLDEIRQAVNEKYRFALTSDPTAIAQAINNQNTTIKMASHPNAPGFNISATDTQSQVPKADNELLDTLNSWFVTVLGVPHSVLNQLNEAEFSRSVATTNLFFSKMVRTYQSILCEHTSHYVRTAIRFYPTLQKKMFKILEGTMSKATKEVKEGEEIAEVKANTSEDVSQTKAAMAKKMLMSVIKNIEIGLPAPNISPDKAQYEIFTDYLRMINELIDGLFPNELVSPDSDLSDIFGSMKAFFKSSVTKQFTLSTGLHGAFELPSVEEFIFDNQQEIKSLFRTLRNHKAGIDKDKIAQTTESNPEGEESSESGDTTSEESSGSSDEYGGWKF